QAHEEPHSVVLYQRSTPVNRLWRADHVASQSRRQRLVSQAHSQNRDLWSQFANQIDADSGLMGSARTGGDNNRLGRHLANFSNVGGVVAHDLCRTPQLGQIPGQVVDEAVVVVDQENHFNLELGFRISNLTQDG